MAAHARLGAAGCKDDAQHIADQIATLASTGPRPVAPALAAESPPR